MCYDKNLGLPNNNKKFDDKAKMVKKIIITKKSINLIKYSNIITFETHSILNKKNMKRMIEVLLGHAIEKINSLIGMRGYKKYFVKINKNYSAKEIISCIGFKID
uniref:Ribosomal protein L23 n=1 Tax=Lotharella vacuolata TaxID=74820 RepID=A0A0H5BHK9_9EUKA|nr:ribosomal protein L23 [Lotharella vacuolata]